MESWQSEHITLFRYRVFQQRLVSHILSSCWHASWPDMPSLSGRCAVTFHVTLRPITASDGDQLLLLRRDMQFPLQSNLIQSSSQQKPS
jgi:hypothetical protein